MQALPSLRTATSLEVLVRIDAPSATSGDLIFSYWMRRPDGPRVTTFA